MAVDRPGSRPEDHLGSQPSQWGTALPGVQEFVPASAGGRTLALTFDACGGPGGSGVDEELLALLRAEGIPATLFLNRRWVRAQPKRTAALAADPLFAIGNHGTAHVPLSVDGRAAYGIPGTRSPAEVVDEIMRNQEAIAELTGRAPVWFRAGTAHYDDVAVEIAKRCGVRLAGFAVNGDAGATASPWAVATALADAPNGAIVLMHMNQPASGAAAGLGSALAGLKAAGTRFVQL